MWIPGRRVNSLLVGVGFLVEGVNSCLLVWDMRSGFLPVRVGHGAWKEDVRVAWKEWILAC